MARPRGIAGFCALSVLAAFAGDSEAKVWVLDKAGGPGSDFTAANSAVAAAAEGDTLLVRPGDYGALFITGKSLTVIKDSLPGVVQFTTPNIFEHNGVASIGAGQSVQVRGVRFTGFTRVFSSVGSVLFEDCEFLPGAVTSPFDATLRVDNCTSVIARGCEIVGSAEDFSALPLMQATAGLLVQTARVSLFDSQITGGKGRDAGTSRLFSNSTPGDRGCVLESGQIIAQSCTVTGGAGGNGFDAGIFSEIGAAGGDGIALSLGSKLWTATDCAIAGGAGGFSPPSSPPPPAGQAIVLAAGTSHVMMATHGREITAGSPIRALQLGTLDVAGDPGDVVALLVSAQQGTALTPWLSGNLALSGAILPLAAFALPPSGTLSISAPIPALPPGVDSAMLVLQAAFCPPAGPCALGAPTHLVVLSPAF